MFSILSTSQSDGQDCEKAESGRGRYVDEPAFFYLYSSSGSLMFLLVNSLTGQNRILTDNLFDELVTLVIIFLITRTRIPETNQCEI